MSRLAVHAFADEEAPAARLASALGASLGLVTLHRYPDGERMPTVPESPETVVVYRSLDHPDEKLIPLLLAADAWRRAGVRRLVLAAPYLCYMRQDAVFAAGQPLSRDVILPMLGRGFDRLVTVQAHLHRTHDLAAAFGGEAVNLGAVGVLAPHLVAGEPPVIVGPDAESAAWAREWAAALGGAAYAFTKVRSGDRSVRLDADWLDSVSGRRAVVVDDVASSGMTLAQAVSALSAAGAASIEVAVVHALFDAEAERRIRDAGASRIISTDSVLHPTNAAQLAPLLAEALRQEVRS